MIINYFDQYRFDSERLLINITNDLKSMTSIDDKNAVFIAEKIISTYVKPDDKHSSKNIVLSLTVSGSSYGIIRIIENNLLKDISLSQYIKDMFNSYLSIPRSEREAIIFKDTSSNINMYDIFHKILCLYLWIMIMLPSVCYPAN